MKSAEIFETETPPSIVERESEKSLTDVAEIFKSEHKKGRHESPIWKHVTKIGDKIKCNYCQKDYKDFKNTTNMLRHLKTQHPLFFEQEKQPIAPTKRRRSKSLETPKIYFIHKLFKLAVTHAMKIYIKYAMHEQFTTLNFGFDKQVFFLIIIIVSDGAQCDKINNAILFFISRDIQPISVVENEGFTTLIKILSPLYKVPSAKTVTKQLEARYEVMKINFIDEIKSSLYYCFTCDVWTDISNTSYMGITIHYTTADVEFKSGNLGCIPLSDRHTAENLAEQFKTVLKDFQISLMNEKYFIYLKASVRSGDSSDIVSLPTEIQSTDQLHSRNTFSLPLSILLFDGILPTRNFISWREPQGFSSSTLRSRVHLL
uniref:BED-type domain-containing protein n=1 Tax=Trichogramma kaykai TaxID=54128 RepID=A0ABD2W166_9HYME